MWEMLEDINFECDDCGGPGPPPKFMIPPPPRPPFMQELIKCKEDDISSSSSSSSSGGGSNSNSLSSSNSDTNYYNNWDSDICDAIPILDASYHSSPSLQTSAIIAVFSLLLVLVVLVSSLFVWKHKRKVQNFLPCKTPTRGPHIGGNVSGAHSVTYEDPDAHLGHRPLMMRHHHNVEIMHHSKSIHYPSGYPMTRSPPLFVCSSPGPDPYRSNDNVYEELGPTRDSDIESEPGQQSDDDFAEDELSLPGERSFHKSSPPDQSVQSQPVSTIYHERSPSTNLHERNTLLTSSVHSEPNRTVKNNRNINGNTTTSGSNSGGGGGILSGVFRHTTGRNKNLVIPNCKTNNRIGKYQNHNTLPYNIDSGGDTTINHQQSSDIIPPQIYEDPNSRNSLMTLAYNSNSNCNNINNNNNFQTNNGNSSCNNLNINNSSNNNNRQQTQHCFNNTLETEVERRNRINNQLHQAPLKQNQPPVATIFRGGERINYTSRYPQPYYTQHHGLINNQSQQQFSRSRTNPRSLDRRRIITEIPPPPPPSTSEISSTQLVDEPSYGYAEPVFHEGLLYNHHHHNNLHSSSNNAILRQAYPAYILPDYTTGTYRTLASSNNNNHQHNHHHHNHNHQPSYHYPSIYNHNSHSQDLLQSQQTQQHQLYSRDSSFGSDSGYSHNTQGSSLTGDIIIAGGRGNCRNNGSSSNGSGGSNGIRTPSTETKYHSQQNYNNNNNSNNTYNKNNSNGSNFLWNRKIPPQSVASLSSQSTNNSISSSNCTKDNNLLSQETNVKSTNSTATTTNTDGAGIVNGDGGIIVVNSEKDPTTITNNCNNSKNSISNISAQSNNSQNNNNLNINNQMLSSKSNSNNSLGSMNNNSNLNCLNGSNSCTTDGINGVVLVGDISNTTNNRT